MAGKSGKMKADSPALWQAETAYRFSLLDHAGDAASIKVDVFKGAVHFSTDYMLLYRMGGGWRIVSKIYSVPKS